MPSKDYAGEFSAKSFVHHVCITVCIQQWFQFVFLKEGFI